MLLMILINQINQINILVWSYIHSHIRYYHMGVHKHSQLYSTQQITAVQRSGSHMILILSYVIHN